VSTPDVAAALAAVRARIAAAAARAGRDAGGVRLIAVSKSKPAEVARAALAAGVRDIGENYVQEAMAKRSAVGDAATWHLIGHLQRNKAARALAIFEFIHTLDSVALGETVARHAAARGRPRACSSRSTAAAKRARAAWRRTPCRSCWRACAIRTSRSRG
jgi:uncharacterized pyridoxal phosphate-containing UPF0001 family protein